jgi:hypothetical protein
MFRVTSDKAHNNGFFFSSLKTIYASQLDALEGLFQRSGYQSKL